MSQKHSQNGFEKKVAGDITTGPISLSEITAVNPSFMNLIGANQPQPSIHDDEGQPPVKRNPEDIAKQLGVALKRKPMPTSQKTIEILRVENFQLKMKIHHLKTCSSKEKKNFDTEGIEKDLVEYYKIQYEELQKQVEERDRKELRKKEMQKDISCQTNLDNLNIEELFKANATLKRMKDQQRIPHSTSHNQQLHQMAKPQRQNEQTQQPIVSQLHYPNVTISQQAVAVQDQMQMDEKAILNGFFKVHGALTTLKDLMKAASDTS